jgi:hypothetical protein
MSLSEQASLEPISIHALRRWLERVDGLDMPEAQEDLTAVLNAWRAGLCDLHDVHRRMMTPAAKFACALGNGMVKQNRHTLVIRNGRVTTVIPTTQAPFASQYWGGKK